MAGSATVQIVGTIGTGSSFGANSPYTTPQVTVSSAVDERLPLALSTSPTNLSVPSGSTYLYVVPPTNNTFSISLRGVSGDTGIPLSRVNPSLIGLDATSPPSQLVLVAGGAVTVQFAFL